ncbi:MAG: hypothetical protein AAF798_08115 [Bacteroidota bacterium]
MTWQEIYKELLWVRLGPYECFLPKGSWVNNWSTAFQHFGKLAKDVLLYGKKDWQGAEELEGKVWLMVGSQNNRDSLVFFQEQLEGTVWVATNKKAARLAGAGWLSLHGSLWYWYKKHKLLLLVWRTFGAIIWRKPDEWLFALGRYEAALNSLKKHRPKALIFANDHVPTMRAFLLAANALGIPTVYIQHASVSTFFPPLRFSLSLLEGQDSLDKYERCGPITGKVKLIGMPKFDHYLSQRKTAGPIQNVAICGTFVDNAQRLSQLTHQLYRVFPKLQFSFRAHPRDDRPFDLPKGIRISNARQESIFDFLLQQDVLIAGDTSTHLEAVLLNINALYFPFNDSLSDYYGFIKQGLVESLQEVDALIDWLRQHQEQRPAVFERASYYNAVVGTEQEGQSRALAVAAVREVLNAKKPYL